MVVEEDFLCVLCVLVLWVEVWCGALVCVAAMTGDAAKARAGGTKANAAIRRLNEVITSGCSGLRGTKMLDSRGELRALID